jgi:amidase
VADLRLCLSLVSGRDTRDPRSVDAPLGGPEPEDRRIALVADLPSTDVPQDTVAAVVRAGELLANAGWTVEQVSPPEVLRVGEVWQRLMATDLSATMPMVEPMVSAELFEHVMQLCRAAKLHEVSNNRLHEERSRLMRAWSCFFSEHPVAVGPNLTAPPWPPSGDLDPRTPELLARATRFILPGNALSLPVVAYPMRVGEGPPAGIQVYADLWREDLCLKVADVIEQGAGRPQPIDPMP